MTKEEEKIINFQHWYFQKTEERNKKSQSSIEPEAWLKLIDACVLLCGNLTFNFYHYLLINSYHLIPFVQVFGFLW